MMFIGGSARIFVSIAAYRDTETPKTVKSLLENADRPHLVRIGILNQLDTYHDEQCKVGGWTNVHECIVDYTQSKGACWARNFIFENLLRDEDFVLQIDSHSRFDKGWDTSLLKMFEEIGEPNTVISHYPVPYDALTNVCNTQMYTRFDVQSFNQWGLPMVTSAAFSVAIKPDKPVKTPFIAGGCLFTRAKTIKTVPYDPYLYFQGEEINYAVRLFTNGFNVYLPQIPFMYHDYGNNRGRKLHWQDNATWKNYNQLALQRLRHLLELETASDPKALENISRYSLGNRRTLSEWERFAGLNLRNRVISQKAKTGSF